MACHLHALPEAAVSSSCHSSCCESSPTQGHLIADMEPPMQERLQAAAKFGGGAAEVSGAKTFDPDEELAGATANAGVQGYTWQVMSLNATRLCSSCT